MATNFSPCKGSYVLNQFPSNVMFGMNGFHISASGAIQGHHGPLVLNYNFIPNISHLGLINPFPNKPWFFTCLQYKSFENTMEKGEIARNEQFLLFPRAFLPFLRTFYHFHQI